MTPIRFFVTTRAPRADNDLGKVEWGWFMLEGDEVLVTDQDGAPCSARNARRKLKEGEDARRVAGSLLRQRLSRKASKVPIIGTFVLHKRRQEVSLVCDQHHTLHAANLLKL